MTACPAARNPSGSYGSTTPRLPHRGPGSLPRIRARCRAGWHSTALSQWEGTARAIELLAVALGFGSVADLLEQADRMWSSTRNGEPSSETDWRRVLRL